MSSRNVIYRIGGIAPMSLVHRLRDDSDDCTCEPQFREPDGTGVGDHTELVLDATDCDGTLASEPACRATAVRALARRDADRVITRTPVIERTYADRAAALLLAAGRFHERVVFHDEQLAETAAMNPLTAAREATGRAGPVSRIAAETGLAELAANVPESEPYAHLLRPYVGPTVAGARIADRVPPTATLVDRWESDTGAAVRLYDTDDPLRRYHVTPPEAALDDDALATLADARRRLTNDEVGGDRAPARAVRAVADRDDPVEELSRVLRKHTRGNGVLEDIFADARVSDAFLSAPVAENPLRVVVDGERLDTNVRMPPDTAATLASRLRRASGRAFSRASPTLDATLDAGGESVRVAATTEPASDGLAFTFRRRDDEPWTLPRLVDAETLTAEAAALLSVAVEHGAAGLVAGGRSAGKTTTLSALLWELAPGTRLICVEDTPELPIAELRTADRDVQRLRVGDGPELTATEAVRTALRLGDGALVVGEVRGDEASALYEAMRVGAQQGTVLGTIHGGDAAAVRERVVTDLGVPESAFGATDLIVTLEDHRVTRIVEVRDARDGVDFEPLYERSTATGGSLSPTGVIDRGNSRLLGGLTEAATSYADLRERLAEREQSLTTLVEEERIRSDDVASAVANR